jgi:hypothetical protein
MGMKKFATAPTATLALGLFFTPTVSIAIDAIISTVASLVSPAIGNLSVMSPAMGQPDALTKKQSDALSAYNNAVSDFESILGQRRAQINSNQRLPKLARTGTLPCTHQHDERIQRPYRRDTLQNRSTQQIRHSTGIF